MGFSAIAGRKTIVFKNSPDHVIMNPKFTIYRADLMAAYRIGNFTFGPGVGLEDKFFYNVVNASIVDADVSRDQKYYLHAEYSFFTETLKKSSINFKFGFNPKEKSGIYDIQQGFFHSGSFKVEPFRIKENYGVGFEIYYKGEDYETIGMFYLVYINVRNGTKRILSSPLMDIVHVYKIHGINYYYHFLFKGVLRDFLVGLKAAMGYGLLLVVVSEFSVSRNGIGHFIWQSWDQFRIADMYAGILILCLLGLFIFSLLDAIIDRLHH